MLYFLFLKFLLLVCCLCVVFGSLTLHLCLLHGIDREFITCSFKIRKNSMSGCGLPVEYYFGLLIIHKWLVYDRFSSNNNNLTFIKLTPTEQRQFAVIF